MKIAHLLWFGSLSMLCLRAQAQDPDAELQATIATLDHEVFDSFNRCTDPVQLAKHAAYFDPAVEFYHDTGGVTWTREAMLANTRKHVCGHYTRELVPGSMTVYPVHSFGAISQGQHRFCDTETAKCEGLADFTIIWRLHDGQWAITRVLSYAHRAAGKASAAVE